jgi:hypothetical protein
MTNATPAPASNPQTANAVAAAATAAYLRIGGQRLRAAATAAQLWADSLSPRYRGGVVPAIAWGRAFDLLRGAIAHESTWTRYGVRDIKDGLGDMLGRMTA